MLSRIIEFSIQNRLLVVALTLLVAVGGVAAAWQLPIDAVPDMTNVQVQILTDAGALSPLEVEKYVSYPIELSMEGLPKLEQVRSVSKFGLSVVTVVFEEGTDVQWARQLVSQRLMTATAKIPPGFAKVELGPMSTALGEILQFEVRGRGRSPMDLRTLLEWEIAPKLREVHGITDINTHGGFYKSFEVRPNPDRLSSYHISLEDLFRRIEDNNQIAGGGYVVHNGEQRFIRGTALLKGVDDIEEIVLRREENGTPILVRDAATVTIAPLTRQGAATRDGRGEIVVGMVMMLSGENSRDVVNRAKLRLAEIQSTLPPGVTLEIIYDRSSLIGRTLKTVLTNLCEGGLLVVAVLFAMLGSVRAGLVVGAAIPLSMMFATNLMSATGVTASLMSLGAIDFGLLVDSSVIMVENCVRRLAQNDSRSHLEIIRDAAIEVRRPTMFGELIIAVVYLPVLALQGTEGKLFRPMAMTVLFALCGSLILSMTFMPAIATLVLPRTIREGDVWLVRHVKRFYEPLLRRAIARPVWTAAIALAVFGLSVPVARFGLGADFMPRLEEGDLLIEAYRLPTATLEDSIAMSTRIETELRRFPEVRTVFCKTGRPEIANDMMGVNETDVWVMLKPRAEWPRTKTREELSKEMDDRLSPRFTGVHFTVMQPIEMRVDELVAGVKADVAALIYGDDLNVLNSIAKSIERVLQDIPGSSAVKASFTANLSTIRIEPNREALARYGIDAARVMDVVASLGGRETGQILDGRARFPIRVRVPEPWRTTPSLLEQLPVAAAKGKPVPLKQLASIVYEETPPSVEHESGRRRAFVSANVRGRDVAGFVHDAQRAIRERVVLPPHYEIRWGGDFENLESAARRLMLITPIVLFVIFLLLHATFGSVRLALLIFLAVPMAASGGIFALVLRGMPFSISAGVGFIALFGVAVLNGLVWVSAAEHLRLKGTPLPTTSFETGLVRLRPILMTALVASLGFLPMALSTSDGAELQRPLASVVIGGIVTSTLLTSLVIPAIYPWFAPGVLPNRNGVAKNPHQIA